MVNNKNVKNVYYLDQKTDLERLVNSMQKHRRAELIEFLEAKQNKLQSKKAGEYYTIEDVVKAKDGELENMQRFFRGAVVPYYVRQEYDLWDEKISAEYLKRGTKEIKKQVGFMRYDHTGHMTKEVNSMATFRRVKDLREFLDMIEDVCFNDRGYIYPDSDYFNTLETQKGRSAAKRQVFLELKEKAKNKHYNRELLNE